MSIKKGVESPGPIGGFTPFNGQLNESGGSPEVQEDSLLHRAGVAKVSFPLRTLVMASSADAAKRSIAGCDFGTREWRSPSRSR